MVYQKHNPLNSDTARTWVVASSLRHLTLRQATETAQRAIPTKPTKPGCRSDAGDALIWNFAERGCARSVSRSASKMLRLVCDTAALHSNQDTARTRQCLTRRSSSARVQCIPSHEHRLSIWQTPHISTYEMSKPSAFKGGFYPHRTARGHRHHRDSRGHVVAGSCQRQGEGQAHPMFGQPQANRSRRKHLCR